MRSNLWSDYTMSTAGALACFTAALSLSVALAPTLRAQSAQSVPSANLIPSVPSTQPTLIDGFGLTYTGPANWTLSGRQGRIHAWTNAAQTAALVVYGGHFSSLELALGDAQRALGVPREEDMRIIAPLGPKTFGALSGIAGSVRVMGQSPVVAHVAAAQLNDSTVLGAVVVLDAATADSILSVATQWVADLLSGARIASPVADTSLASRITGKWAVSTAYSSSPTTGGYTNDESWTFSDDGAFAYSKRFAVSMPGGNITPEARDDAGRWYAVGGAIVLVSDEGRLTVDVQLDGAKLLLDGTTFTRQ